MKESLEISSSDLSDSGIYRKEYLPSQQNFSHLTRFFDWWQILENF